MEDAIKQLSESLAKQLAAGVPEVTLKTLVTSQGWSESDFYGALSRAKQSLPQPAPSFIPPAPVSTVPVPAPMPAPVAPVQASAPTPVPSPAPVQSFVQPKKSHTLLFSILILIVLLAVGGIVYAYTQKIGPFAKAPYSQDNLISSLLMKSTGIKSSSDTVSVAFFVEPRDAGAKPFEIKIADDQTLKERYSRDYTRGDDAKNILSALKYRSNPDDPYPASLDLVKNSFSSNPLSFKDPSTGALYAYAVTPGGKGFSLTIAFETPDAIEAIQKESLGNLMNKTTIEGQTVTFTESSSPYFYLSLRPPVTLFESLRDFVAIIPPEVNVKASVSTESSWGSMGSSSEWAFNVDASGDLGDLTYKANIDGRKKADTFYVRINNMPALFFSSMLPPKGQWVSIDQTSKAISGYLPQEITSTTDSYVDQKNQLIAFVKKAALLADSEKLLLIKGSPHKENVGDRSLYRYDMEFNKEAILPFYINLIAEAANTHNVILDPIAKDQAFLNYLKSPEFDQMFSYFKDNVSMVLWTDDAGYPAILEYSIRVVPPAGTTQLEGKQARFVVKVEFSKINEPVRIDVPEDSKPIDEVLQTAMNSLNTARMKGKIAALKANLSMIRAQAEIVYDTNSGYGKKAFPLGPCTETAGTLFGDKTIFAAITSATDKNEISATCVSETKGGQVSSYALSVPLPDSSGYSYCVDSSGAAKEILNKIKGASCASAATTLPN